MYKYIILSISVIILIILCSCEIINLEKKILHKFKFAFCQFRTIKIKDLYENHNNIDSNIEDEINSTNIPNYQKENIILHDNCYIDPFLSGNKRVTVKNWKWAGEDCIPTEMTMSGSPLHYILDVDGNIIIAFAGPDGKLDLKYNDNIIKDIIHEEIYSFVDYHSNVIEYDPTNGLTSSGDIIFVYAPVILNGKHKLRMITNDSIYWNHAFGRTQWNKINIIHKEPRRQTP